MSAGQILIFMWGLAFLSSMGTNDVWANIGTNHMRAIAFVVFESMFGATILGMTFAYFWSKLP